MRFDAFRIEFDENRRVTKFKLTLDGADYDFGFGEDAGDVNDLESLSIIFSEVDKDLELKKEYRYQIEPTE